MPVSIVSTAVPCRSSTVLDLWKNGDGDARLLADLANQFARSNERLQQFCAEPLSDWGYALPANCGALSLSEGEVG